MNGSSALTISAVLKVAIIFINALCDGGGSEAADMFECFKDSTSVATRLPLFIDIARLLTDAFVSSRHTVPPLSWSNTSGQALQMLSVCLQTFQQTPSIPNCHTLLVEIARESRFLSTEKSVSSALTYHATARKVLETFPRYT